MKRFLAIIGVVLLAIIITPLFFGKWLVSIFIVVSIILLPFIIWFGIAIYMLFLKTKNDIAVYRIDKLAKEIAKEQLIIARQIEELENGSIN